MNTQKEPPRALRPAVASRSPTTEQAAQNPHTRNIRSEARMCTMCTRKNTKKPLNRENTVPEVGLEPTHLSIPHFECGASANSATRARSTPVVMFAAHWCCEQRDRFRCAKLLYMQIG
jgi:hypothetical protein